MSQAAHPLAPLGEDEVRAAADAMRSHPDFAAHMVFTSVDLAEPSKAALAAHASTGRVPPRHARAVLYDRSSRLVVEAVADLANKKVVSWRPVEAASPKLTAGEYLTTMAAVKADSRWQAAMARRGVDDVTHVEVQIWPPPYRDAAADGRRVANAFSWVGRSETDNTFARPVENLIAVVDLDTAEVLAVEDHGIIPLPTQPGNYIPDLAKDPANFPPVNEPRQDVRPLEITQPDGPSFTLDDHELSWQRWRLMVGFTTREGLVLHQVRYLDGGRERSIVHRASLSEMWVPYGDPAPVHRAKAVFDEGEAGLGMLANPLRLGCDCLGEIRYLDVVVSDDNGQPVRLQNAICIHEEDTGIAWKHTQQLAGTVEVRRGRRLVISSISTVGNYDYGFYWYLHTDGTLAFEVKLTGILSTGAVAPGAQPAHGAIVAPGLYGPHHQHFFNVRLDTAIDGDANTVLELDAVPCPAGPENPVGNAWVAAERPLESEREGERAVEPAVGRTWLIANEGIRNAHGRPVAYQLVPGPSTLPPLQPDAPAMARAGFATKQLWVTAFDPDQLHAAGSYPFRHPGGAGLPSYTREDRPIRNADIVVWHTFVSHHVVRPEDWPVMPVATTGFHLRPFGFFDANPALDLPTPEHCTTDKP